MEAGKNILIADAGGTGTRWCLTDKAGDVKRDLHAGAINACVMSETEIYNAMLGAETLMYSAGEIHFYGAGCATDEQCNRVYKQLRKFGFKGDITVNSDMYGAARALLGNSPGIACILGTGSNSCMFNGTEITAQVSPLGYILGDEGSGAAIGKRLLKDLLRNELPEEISEQFFQENSLTIHDIYEHVYRQPIANMYLASLTKFINKHINDTRVRRVVEDEFESFFSNIISRYAKSEHMPIAFIGSVAYYFGNILRTVASRHKMNVVRIERNPIEGLIKYHVNNK
ncbi:MAG: ATPase [Prevotella sp.]|nr:ATPase [Prevotella sp.]MCM1075224.1 hypothetical protein [Ruminococcus sp.]